MFWDYYDYKGKNMVKWWMCEIPLTKLSLSNTREKENIKKELIGIKDKGKSAKITSIEERRIDIIERVR